MFPELGHIPAENKDLVLTEPDDHGMPGAVVGPRRVRRRRRAADAYDWNFCWKIWDALRSAAADGGRSSTTLGDTPEHRSNGIVERRHPDRPADDPGRRTDRPLIDRCRPC